MMRLLLLIFALFISSISFAQDRRTGSFPKSETKSNTFPSSGLGTISAPSLSGKGSPIFEASIKESDRFKDLGKKKEREVDMVKGDGLMEYVSDIKPRGYGQRNEGKMPQGRNQSFVDILTEADQLHVLYRDHQVMDGDRIRVLVNDEVVIYDTMLETHFKGLHLPLKVGVNKIDFIALNQGDSGPNTAELHVYDDNKKLISANEWNLLTGYKATVIIIKQADEYVEPVLEIHKEEETTKEEN